LIPVIIPFYKNRQQLDKCIEHLKKQSMEVEIYVRDNSVDNIYFTAAVNEGIRQYLGRDCDYIILLNQDMYLEPTAVEEMFNFMQSHPRCGIGAPIQVHADYPDHAICAGSLEAYPLGEHQHGPLADFADDEKIFWANGACMILRKNMVHEIGLLDENMMFIASDSDYSFSARSRGWQVWRIAAAKGIHEHGATGQISDPKMELIKINDVIYFGSKWLTGGLYQKLAYDGQDWNPIRVGETAQQLEAARLKKLKELCLDNGRSFNRRQPGPGDQTQPASEPNAHADGFKAILETYQQLSNMPSDINEHLPTLQKYAAQCRHITEMGVRSGTSTWSLLAGRPHKLVSYDFTYHPNIEKIKTCAQAAEIDYQFIQKDVLDVEIENTDLLFLDTLHHYFQLTQELIKHPANVNKYLIFHDTTQYAFADEPFWEDVLAAFERLGKSIFDYLSAAKKGLWPAIEEFLAANRQWHLKERFENNNGLTILERRA